MKYRIFVVNSDGTTAEITDKVARVKIERTIERMLDVAHIDIAPGHGIHEGQEVIITAADGITRVFGGYVARVKKGAHDTLEVAEYGWELHNKIVQKVYTNTAPEDIVKDIIQNYSSLTYASTITSGLTISKFVANGYAMDIINQIAALLDWQARATENKEFYFEPKGYSDSGLTFVDGKNCVFTTVRRDATKLCNHLFLRGDNMTYQTEQSFTGDGTTKEFTLNYKPTSVRVLIDGAEQPTNSYSVFPEERKIVFNTAPAAGANITVQYTYLVPLFIEIQNPSSINIYGEHSLKLEKRFLKTPADLKKYAQKYLEIYSRPLLSVEVSVPPTVTVSPGQMANFVSQRFSVNDKLVIYKIVREYPGQVKIYAQTSEYNVYDWQAEVQERIKQLEEQTATIDKIIKYMQFSARLGAAAKIVKRIRIAHINDSFILGHPRNSILGETPLGDRRTYETIYQDSDWPAG